MASGDDDLFIQKMASKFKVTCSLSEETFMYSNGPSGWAEWLNQKSRHISTSTKYDTFTKLVLGAFGFSQLTWPLVVLSGFKYGLALVLARWFLLMFMSSSAFKRMKESDLIWWFPFLDLGLAIYYIAVLPLMLIRNKAKW